MSDGDREIAGEFDLPRELPPAGDSVLAALRKEIQECGRLTEEAEAAEAAAKKANKELLHKRLHVIPDLMLQIQSDDFTHAGLRIQLKTLVSGVLPKDAPNKEAAIRWLDENDGGGIIKMMLSMDFPRSMREEALAVHDMLVDNGQSPIVETGVHSQTLQAFARERMKEGKPIDLDVLGLKLYKIASVEPVKEK
jgi:hypothetical protein